MAFGFLGEYKETPRSVSFKCVADRTPTPWCLLSVKIFCQEQQLFLTAGKHTAP